LSHFRFKEINKNRRNRFAVEDQERPFPRVAAQRGDPGLEVVAPLGQRNPQRLVNFHKASAADGSTNN
jgi:hypothetical protein